MMDRETIIKGLEIERECVSRDCDRDCGKCDLVQDRDWLLSVYDGAIALLKEQEAVKPILEQDSMVCGVCGHEVIWQKMLGDGIWADEELDYCPHCGRKVKWDDI